MLQLYVVYSLLLSTLHKILLQLVKKYSHKAQRKFALLRDMYDTFSPLQTFRYSCIGAAQQLRLPRSLASVLSDCPTVLLSDCLLHTRAARCFHILPSRSVPRRRSGAATPLPKMPSGVTTHHPYPTTVWQCPVPETRKVPLPAPPCPSFLVSVCVPVARVVVRGRLG